MIINVYQVYLVTGGYNGGTEVDSTEVLLLDGEWTEVGLLPLAMTGLKGVSLNNNIIMAGIFIIQQ